jgi:hypothetical protein
MSYIVATWIPSSWWDVIATVFTVLLFLGVIFAFWQLKAIVVENRREAFARMLEEWGRKEAREERRYVIRDFEFGSCDDLDDSNILTDEHRKTVESVLVACNRISFMVVKKIVSPNDVMDLVGQPMKIIWGKTKHFIRKRRQNESLYMQHFEKFYKQHLCCLNSKATKEGIMVEEKNNCQEDTLKRINYEISDIKNLLEENRRTDEFRFRFNLGFAILGVALALSLAFQEKRGAFDLPRFAPLVFVFGIIMIIGSTIEYKQQFRKKVAYASYAFLILGGLILAATSYYSKWELVIVGSVFLFLGFIVMNFVEIPAHGIKRKRSPPI